MTNRSRSASRSSALTATWVAPAAAYSLTIAAMSRAGLSAEAWVNGYLFSLAGPIYGGTDQIQRNTIAERLLKLPREVRR